MNLFSKEVIPAGKATHPQPSVREKTQEAAILALERIIQLLRDPDASHADVLKTAQLIFDRIYPAQTDGLENGGDFDICVKEE